MPVRKSVKLDPKITYGEVLNALSLTSFDQVLNQIMEEKLYDFSEDCLYDMEENILQMYKERINLLAAPHGLPPLDDDDIELESFTLTSMGIIHSFKFVFIKIFSSFYTSFINEMSNVLHLKDDKIKQNLSRIEHRYFDVNENESTIPQLRIQCHKIIQMIKKNGTEQFVNKLIPDSFGQDEVRAANASIERQRTASLNNINHSCEEGRKALNILTENINNINQFEAQYNALDSNTRNLPENIARVTDARQQRTQFQQKIQKVTWR